MRDMHEAPTQGVHDAIEYMHRAQMAPFGLFGLKQKLYGRLSKLWSLFGYPKY